jgi:hypothetical protein
MAALFRGAVRGVATLATTLNTREASLRAMLPYAKSMNSGSHPRIFIVGDDVIILGPLDSAL